MTSNTNSTASNSNILQSVLNSDTPIKYTNYKATASEDLSFSDDNHNSDSVDRDSKITTASKTKFPISCEICGRYQRSTSALKCHMTKYHTIKEFSCSICKLEFARLELFQNHQKKIKKCTLCDFSSCNNLKYRQHLAKLHNQNVPDINNMRMKCKECSYSATNEEQMLRHVRRVHLGENPYQCNMCQYSTYNSAVFREHVNVHNGIKPYKCAYCDYRSASKKNTKKHEDRHQPNNENSCQVCGILFHQKIHLKSHMAKLHNIVEQKENKGTCNRQNTNCGLKQNNCDIIESKGEVKNISGDVCSSDISSCNNDIEADQCEEMVSNQDSIRKISLNSCDDISNENKVDPLGITGLKSYSPSTGLSTSSMKNKGKLFSCSLCKWSSNTRSRILLHLIHHPNQMIDERVIDLSILRKCRIVN